MVVVLEAEAEVEDTVAIMDKVVEEDNTINNAIYHSIVGRMEHASILAGLAVIPSLAITGMPLLRTNVVVPHITVLAPDYLGTIL